MFEVAIEEVAMLPVPITVKWQDGTSETYNLPRLGTEDFIPWLADETQKRRSADQAAIAKANLAPRDRWAAEKAALLDEATVPDLALRVQQPDGIKKVLYASMAKSGMTQQAQDRLYAILPAYIRVNLATVLSTLFQPAPTPVTPPAATGGGSKGDPFASAPPAPKPDASDTATTGLPTA